MLQAYLVNCPADLNNFTHDCLLTCVPLNFWCLANADSLSFATTWSLSKEENYKMKFTVLFACCITIQNVFAFKGLFGGGKQAEILEIVGISGTICNTDSECSHGRCDTKTKTCSCDLGWTGKTCNEMVKYTKVVSEQTPQMKTKKNNEHSYLINALNKAKKAEQRPKHRKHPIDLSAGVKFKTTPNIEVKLVKNAIKDTPAFRKAGTLQSSAPIDLDIQAKDLKTLMTELEESDACSDKYKYRPREERHCVTGLECKYGKCSSMNYGSYIAFECKCDRGAKGLLCEQKCCLNCGTNGRCDFKPDGTPFCFCRRGFYGYRCEFSFSKMLQKDQFPIHATSSTLPQQL